MEDSWIDMMGRLSGVLPQAEPTPQIQLRPHQQEAMFATFRAYSRGVKRPLVNMPTGAGKTIFAGHTSLRFKRTLFLVHKGELLEQTVETFKRLHPEIDVGVIWGKNTDIDKRIVVGMIQTVYHRLKDIPRDHFNLVIVDEAHHSLARTWRVVIEHFEYDMLLGLSATPERLDGAPLSHLFDEVVYSLTLKSAIKLKLLVPMKAFRVKTQVNIDHVSLFGADLDERQLEMALNTPERNRLVVEQYLKLAKGTKAICYTCGVRHAIDLADAFQQAGVPAAAVWGQDPLRHQKLQQSRKGEILVITNSDFLVEGYDDPALVTCLMARPSQSKNFFVQALGRVLRLHPGKEYALAVDFTDNCSRHNLQSAWQFYGDPEYQEPEKRNPHRHGRTKLEMEDGFEKYRMLAGGLSYHQFTQVVPLLQLPPDVDSFTYGDPEWHVSPATEKQLLALQQNGYDTVKTEWTKAQAQAVILQFPPTINQLLALLSYGYDIFTRPWNRMQASAALNEAKFHKVTPDWQKVTELLPEADRMKQKKSPAKP